MSARYSVFDDATCEGRLTHDPDPVLGRHAAHLGLLIRPVRRPPGSRRRRGAPIAGVLAAMIAYDGVTRIGPAPEPFAILPTSVG